MPVDEPEIGLVIRHVYLWRDEHNQGHEEGRKARPCLIVHKRQNEYDETEVFICPITHTPPQNPDQALEIPLATKQRLKLDDERSWIIISEVNRFIWKGPDVRRTEAGEFAYGFLPHALTQKTVTRFRDNARERRLGIISRDDEALLKQMRQRRGTKTRNNNNKDRER